MWELGVRHALAKRTILVARKDVMSEKIISDLSTNGVIPYDPTNLTKATQFKRDIKDVLKKIDTEPDRSDNPVFDFLKQEEIIQLRFENTKNIKKLSGLITELIDNYRIAEGIINKKFNVKKDVLTRNRYSTQCMEMLLSTNYVNLKITPLKKLGRIIGHSKWANEDMLDVMTSFNDGKDAQDSSLKDIMKYTKIIHDEIIIIIPILNEYLENLKQNKKDGNEVPIWMWEQSHQKLIK